MKFTIDNQGQQVNIEVTEIAGKQQELLAAFQECQAGTCTCPTDEYTKVKSIDIESTSDEIRLVLNLQPDKTIEPAKISDCLHYTEKQIQGE